MIDEIVDNTTLPPSNDGQQENELTTGNDAPLQAPYFAPIDGSDSTPEENYDEQNKWDIRTKRFSGNVNVENQTINLDEITREVGNQISHEQLSFDTKPLEDLKSKNVLIVSAPNDDILDTVLTDLALNLGEYKALSWPDVSFLKRVLKDKEDKAPLKTLLNCQEFPNPTVIAFFNPKTDFVKNLLLVQKGEADDEIRIALQKRNLFVVCLLTEQSDNKQTIASSQPLKKGKYGYWEAPVVKMSLTRRFGQDGHALFEVVEEKNLIKQYGQTQVFEAIQHLEDEEIEKQRYVEVLQEKLKEIKEQSDENLKMLKKLFDEGDHLRQTLIFCGAFFSDVPYRDFKDVFLRLLGDDKEEPATYDKDAPPPKTFRQIWEAKPAKYLDECKLITVQEGRSQRVRFSNPELSESLKKDILKRRYAFFDSAYERFEQTGLVFEVDINETLRSTLIRLMLTAAEHDNRYNADWLTNMVMGIRLAPSSDIPDDANLIQVLNILHLDNRLRRLFISRLEDLIKEMLLSGNEEFKTVVKEFFRNLLNQRDVKRTALEISLKLYYNLQNTPHFPKGEVLRHIRRVLEEGKWDESFAAYDLLISDFPYQDLYKETTAWILDEQIKDNSWTKKFAHLYSLDYCIISQNRWFNTDVGKETYEFFSDEEASQLSNVFPNVVQSVTNEKALNAWKELLTYRNAIDNIVMFEKYCAGLEFIVTGLPTLLLRLSKEFNEPYTLTADLFENWFFILVGKAAEELDATEDLEVKQENIWKKVILIIKNNTPERTLNLIIRYLRQKSNIYTETIIALAKLKDDATELRKNVGIKSGDVKSKIEKLKTRRLCVRYFVQLLNATTQHS